MVEVNKGIMNYGTIGGDAKVKSVVTHTGSSDDHAQREKLNELIQQLHAALSQIPPTHRDGADAIARQAQVLAEAANAKSPSKTFIQVSGEALKATAKFVSDVAPSVAPIITAIVAAVGAL
jgi:hypothetical protein